MLTTKSWSDASSAAAYYLSSERIDQVGQALWYGKMRQFLSGWPEQVNSDNLMQMLEPGFAGKFRSDKQPAVDFAFTAPKPVSVLAALADDESTRMRIVQAHLDAVHKGLNKIEAEYAMVKVTASKAQEIIRLTDGRLRPIRTGAGLKAAKGGKNKSKDTEKDPSKEQVYLRTHNLIAALFTHFCTRPVDGEPDPNLHTHCLVPRITQRGDGEWGTLHIHLDVKGPEINRPYSDALLENLKRMGIAARPDSVVGIAIEGIGDDLLDAFSRRSRKIAAICDASDKEYGGAEVSAAEKRRAALFTREPKGDIPWQERLAGWQLRALSAVAMDSVIALQDMMKDEEARQAWELLCNHLEQDRPADTTAAAERPRPGAFPQGG